MRSLAIKYRPKTFEEVCGQELTVKILKRSIETNRIKNAYLFAGESGAGKTTLARIFAKELNKGIGDPIEIDAASNNGVDQVRAIVDSASQRSLTGTYKIFIIDECHSITTQGWQAFLKGIEEPSPFTIFMFCTTEPNKLPQAILNRVQRYNISKIPQVQIRERLRYICQQEGFINYDGTCDLISKTCGGCMRDAITSLDQCADLSTDLSLENTKYILGESYFERMMKLTNCLRHKKEEWVLIAVETLANEGQDLKHFINKYLEVALDLIKYKLFGNIDMTSLPEYLETSVDPMVNIAETVNFEDSVIWLNKLVECLLEIKAAIRYDSSSKATIEAYLLRMCRAN